jgi:hypothetical protein
VAGMRALGRVYDVLASPSGIDICLKDCSGIGFLAVNGTSVAAILTVVAKPSFGGASANWTPANGFGQPNTGYTRLTGLTANWVSQSLTGGAWSSNVLTNPISTTSAAFYVDFLVSELADTYDYINVTVSGSGATLPAAFLYDLTVQRNPVRLRIPAA